MLFVITDGVCEAGMRKVVVVGAGAGGAAAVAQLTGAGHDVRLWARSAQTLAPFIERGGIEFEGVLGSGLAKPSAISTDLGASLRGADCVLICLPTSAHADVAAALHDVGAVVPVVLNPGHTGGALEFATRFRTLGGTSPPICELSTLTYVARKYEPHRVTITGVASQVRAACLPGGETAMLAAEELFRSVRRQRDVLACDLANVNMVLHSPGAVLAASWIEATGGDFTFYVQGMTPGVARVMAALDAERRAVAASFGHDLPSLTYEMQLIGTIETSWANLDDFAGAIASGAANRLIKAPDSLRHRYYVEDFGHGLLPFVELAKIAEVPVPVASSLLLIAQTLLGADLRTTGRTAERMGISGATRDALLKFVGASADG